jgi:hypothetical protein
MPDPHPGGRDDRGRSPQAHGARREKEDAPVRFAVDPADVRLFPVEAGA